MFNLYLEGLSHPNPYVEWYGSNKIIEFDYRPDKQRAIDSLQLLLKSPEDNVKLSAQFALNVLERNFDDPAFVRSPDGKRVAFHPFLGARYNDGRVWMYDKEMDAVYALDGNWLSVINLEDMKSLLSKSVTGVITDKKYYPPIVKQQRPDDSLKAAYTTVKKYPSDYEGSHDEIVKPDGFKL